ncbi:hypothetical protein PENSPDRAFT_215726 [Peniophora sp. CONT]|nr:hypothetical protein PENSPDRAFT_215726 [Peniophora sp. CONT]
MMDVRRERDNEAAARTRLHQDYDTVRIALQQTHAQGAIAPVNAEADAIGRTALEKQVVGARTNVNAALNEQERMRVEAESQQREMVTQLEQAEASAREATQNLVQERYTAQESARRLEAELDEALAMRDKAFTERAEALGLVAAKDLELDALRAELAAKETSAAQAQGPSPVHELALYDAGDSTTVQVADKRNLTTSAVSQNLELALQPTLDEDMGPNWLTSVPETPTATSNSLPEPTFPLPEPKAPPGPSTSANTVKRSVDEVESVELPKPAKRAKKPSHTGAAPSFDYGSTRRLLDAVPPSLNQRVDNLYKPIKPRRIPADMLATRENPTVGWVKRALFIHEYKAHNMLLSTYLNIRPSLLLDHEPATDTVAEQTVKHPALFLALNINPGLPIHPGDSGTIISNRTDIPLGEPVLVVVASLDATCKYVGRYMCRRDKRAITKQEWQCMPQCTRNAWADTLSEKKAYLPLGLQLALSVRRKRDVTDAEVQRLMNQYKAADDKGKAKMRPTKEEVLEGLDKGYGTVGVITLEPLSVGERLYEEIWDKHMAGDCYDKAKAGKRAGDKPVLIAPAKIK